MAFRRRIRMAGGGAPAFTTEYQAVLDYATAQGYAKPSAGNQTKQNQLIVDLKAAAVWQELDIFYCMSTDGSAAFAKINWKNPAANYLTQVGTVTFTINDGFKGNGTTGYFNTGFVPGSAIGVVGNESIFTEIEGFSIGNACGRAAGGTGNSFVIIDPSGSVGSVRVATNTGNYSVRAFPLGGRGFIQGQIIGTNQRINIGTSIGSNQTEAGDFDPANPLFLLAINGGSLSPYGFGDGTMRCFGLGSSMSGKENALYAAWNTYRGITVRTVEYPLLLLLGVGLGFGLPDPATQLKQDDFIANLKVLGIWDAMDAIWVPAFGDGWGTLNLKDPLSHQATIVGTVPHVAGQGYMPNGVDSYLNLNWTPSVDGVHFQQNDASILFASFTDANLGVNDRPVGAWDLTRALQLVPRHDADEASYSLNDGTFVPSTGTVPDSSGFFHVQRDDSVSTSLFRNGTAVGATLAVSNGRPTVPVYAGCVNFNGVPSLFSSRNIALVGFGSAMTGMEAALASIYEALISP